MEPTELSELEQATVCSLDETEWRASDFFRDVLAGLAEKGLAEVNEAGAGRLTPDGAVLAKQLRKKRGHRPRPRRGDTRVETLIALLQTVANTETVLLSAYRASDCMGAWTDAKSVPRTRDPDKSQTEFALFKDRARGIAVFASMRGLTEFASSLNELQTLELGATLVNLWRDVRISIRETLDAATASAGLPRVPPASVRFTTKIRPNASCPCGSGKKYKKCCRP